MSAEGRHSTCVERELYPYLQNSRIYQHMHHTLSLGQRASFCHHTLTFVIRHWFIIMYWVPKASHNCFPLQALSQKQVSVASVACAKSCTCNACRQNGYSWCRGGEQTEAGGYCDVRWSSAFPVRTDSWLHHHSRENSAWYKYVAAWCIRGDILRRYKK